MRQARKRGGYSPEGLEQAEKTSREYDQDFSLEIFMEFALGKD